MARPFFRVLRSPSAIVCAVTVLVTAGDAYSPRISIDPVHFSTLGVYVTTSCLILWNALALALLWMRQRSVLDLWLMVVVCAYAIEICLIAFPGLARFSAGWYAGRVFGFVSSILVLCVLLYEITTLYAQLLRAVLAQRREREARLMTGDAVSASIAHEIKQPLGAIITSANAGLNWLDRVEPDLDEVRDALRLVRDGRTPYGRRDRKYPRRISRRMHGPTLRLILTMSSRKLWPSFATNYRCTGSSFKSALPKRCHG